MREHGRDSRADLGGCRLTRRRFGALTAGGLASLGLPLGSPRRARAEALDARGLAYADADPTAVALAGAPRAAGQAGVERAVRAAAQSATDFSWLSRIKVSTRSHEVLPRTSIQHKP